jgi:hypothetical protein
MRVTQSFDPAQDREPAERQMGIFQQLFKCVKNFANK